MDALLSLRHFGPRLEWLLYFLRATISIDNNTQSGCPERLGAQQLFATRSLSVAVQNAVTIQNVVYDGALIVEQVCYVNVHAGGEKPMWNIQALVT